MSITQIQENIQTLIANIQEETFIYNLLLAYDTPKSTIKRLQADGGLNLSKTRMKYFGKINCGLSI